MALKSGQHTCFIGEYVPHSTYRCFRKGLTCTVGLLELFFCTLFIVMNTLRPPGNNEGFLSSVKNDLCSFYLPFWLFEVSFSVRFS